MKDNTNPLHGVFHLAKGRGHYRLRRYFPTPALAPLVEQFWLVNWTLPPGESHLQENLPDPNCHWVFDSAGSHVQMVVSNKFSYEMRENGRVIGVKFVAGALACPL